VVLVGWGWKCCSFGSLAGSEESASAFAGSDSV
jgi:hypothetical protein